MIKRKAFTIIEESMNNYVIPVIFGLRRIGKTTILKQIKEKYKDSKIISWDSFEYQSMKSVDFFNLMQSECKKGGIILFDEVQAINGWDTMIKNFYDQYVVNKICKIIVTGSSSMILSRKELGLNRTKRIYLDTWDFDEYISLTRLDKTIDNFENFFGRGFPDYALSNEINYLDCLNDILKPIIKEDIGRDFPQLDVQLLLRLIQELSSLTNGEINESRLSRKTSISIITTKKYMDILSQTNLLKKVYKIHVDGSFPKKRIYKAYLNPHFHIWLLRKSFKHLDNKIKGHIIESYWLHWALSINDFRKQFYYLKDSKTNDEIDFVSLNPNGSFKTLHEFKYKNNINVSDYSFMLSIKSTNKIIWTKNKEDLPIKSISILNLNA